LFTKTHLEIQWTRRSVWLEEEPGPQVCPTNQVKMLLGPLDPLEIKEGRGTDGFVWEFSLAST